MTSPTSDDSRICLGLSCHFKISPQIQISRLNFSVTLCELKYILPQPISTQTKVSEHSKSNQTTGGNSNETTTTTLTTTPLGSTTTTQCSNPPSCITVEPRATPPPYDLHNVHNYKDADVQYPCDLEDSKLPNKRLLNGTFDLTTEDGAAGIKADDLLIDSGFNGSSIFLKKDAPHCVSTGDVTLPASPAPWTATMEKSGQCILDPRKCLYGLTVTMWVRMDPDELPKDDRRYFVSTDQSGYSLYHQAAKIWAEVMNEDKLWKASCDVPLGKLDIRPWINVGFRWGKYDDEGLEVLLHGRPCTDKLSQQPPTLLSNGDFTESKGFMIGCRKNPSTGAGLQDFMVGGMDEIAFFARRVADKDLIVALGGFNMLMAEKNHVVTTQTQLSTTTAFPPYDYAARMVRCKDTSSDVNPFYKMADLYISLRQLTGLSASGTAELSDGRMGPSSAVRLGDDAAFVKLGNFKGKCLEYVAGCKNGLAVAVWVLLPKELPEKEAVLLASNLFGTDVRGWAVVWTGKTLQVNVAASKSSYTVPEELIKKGSWFNVAFSLLMSAKGNNMEVYVGGKQVKCEKTSYAPAKLGDNGDPGDFLAGQKGLSVPKLKLSDIVVWYRYLHPFERHRFLGITAREFRAMESSAAFWTADIFMLADHIAMPLYKTKDSTIERVAGPNGPNRAFHLKPDANGWLLMGDSWDASIEEELKEHPAKLKCFVNLVEGCKEGLTVRMWMKLNTLDLPGENYIISTGEQDTKSTGVSVYLKDKNLLVGVGRGTRLKKVAITKDLLPLNKWMELEFSWSRDDPLWVAIDGTVLVKDNRGSYQRRKTDRFSYPMLGRANTNDRTAISGFTDVDIQDVRYVAKYMASDALSRDVNSFYAEAAYFWERETFITSKLSILEQTDRLSGPKPGPSSKDVLVEDKFVSITGDSRLILGSFDDCVSSPEKCSKGLTASSWIRARKLSDYDMTLFSSSSTSPFSQPTYKETGFVVGLTAKDKGHKIKVTVRTKTHTFEVTTDKALPADTWCNVGFTFSTSSGLTVVLDAKEIGKKATGVAETNKEGANSLVLRNDQNVLVGIDYYNLAVWFVEYPESKLTYLVGMKADHFKLMQESDNFWPFDAPWADLIPTPLELKDTATYGTDRFGKRAGKTKKIGNVFPYISLGNHSTSCVVDPSTYKAVIIGMYLHIWEGNRGTLFSSGAQVDENRGVLIEQTGDKGDVLKVTLADGKKVYREWCSANTRKWFYIQIEWTPEKGITIYQDGWAITAIRTNTTDEVREKMDHHFVTLGRDNHNLYTGLVDAEFDDIMFKCVESGAIPKPAVIKESCYDDVDEIKYLDKDDGITKDKKLVQDRYNATSGLELTDEFVTIGDYKDKCVSDPTLCKNGVTVSVWTLLNNLKNTEGYIFSSGAPNSRGLAITAKLDGQSAALKFITRTDDGKWETTTTMQVTADTDWVNLGLSWSSGDGLKAFINGTLVASTTSKVAVSAAVADTHTTVVLGKPNFADGSYATAVYDDLAIWNKALPALKRSKYLRGLCGDIIETVDPSAFTPPPTTTTTPMPTTPFVAPTGVACKEWRCMVCASCEPDALDYSFARVDPNYPSTNMTCINEIILNCIETTGKVSPKVCYHMIAGINATTVAKMTKKERKKTKKKFFTVANNILNKEHRPLWDHNSMDDVYEIVTTVPAFIRHIAMDLPCKQSFHQETNIFTASIQLSPTCAETIATFPNKSEPGVASAMETAGVGDTELQIKYSNKTDSYAEKRQLACTIFTTVSDDYSKKKSKEINLTEVMINSPILTANIHPPLSSGEEVCYKLKHRVSNEYKDTKRKPRKMKTVCAYCEYDQAGRPKEWRTKGLRKIKSDAYSTSCCSSHTTNFAILMQPIPVHIPSIHETVLSVLTYIGLTISLVSLLIFFFLIVLNPNLITERNVIHLNLIVAMIIALLLFLISELVTREKGICQAMAILIHYFFLAAFCWLWVEGLYLFYAVTSGIVKGRLKCYIPFAWGIPLVIVSAAVGMNVDAYGSEWKCWLNADGSHIYSFIGPILLLISLNACVMMIVLCNMSTPAIKREDMLSDVRKAVKNTILLVPTLGLTWVLGLLSVWDPTWTLLYFHVILNSLQGFFIFLFYCVGSRELRDKLLCRKNTTESPLGAGKNSGSLENLVSREKATEVFYLNPLPGTSSDYVPVKPQPKSRPTTPAVTPRKSPEPPPLSPPPVYIDEDRDRRRISMPWTDRLTPDILYGAKESRYTEAPAAPEPVFPAETPVIPEEVDW